MVSAAPEASGGPPATAARFMRQHRADLINGSIVQWTGQRKYTVNMLVQKLIHRCQQLES